MTSEQAAPASAPAPVSGPAPMPWYKAKWARTTLKVGGVVVGVLTGAALGYKGGEYRTEKRLASKA